MSEITMSLCLVLSFSGIDGTDHEWIADGYSIGHEVINPFDYIQPLSGSMEVIGFRTFFLGEEFDYRIILVGGDKLVVFDEDKTQPLEIDLAPYGCWAALFSENGRYVITHGKMNETDNISALIDIDEETVRYFSATENPEDAPPWLYVSNSGVVISKTENVLRYYSISTDSFSESQIEPGSMTSLGITPDGEALLFYYPGESTSMLTAYDLSGRRLWECQSELGSLYHPVFIPESGHFLVSLESAVRCYSWSKGQEIWTIDVSVFSEEKVQVLWPCVSEDGSYWCVAAGNVRCSYEESLYPVICISSLDGNGSTLVSSNRPILSNWDHAQPQAIASNGSVLVRLWISIAHADAQLSTRFILFDRTLEPIWASELIDPPSVRTVSVSDFTIDRYMRPMQATVSPVGDKIVYLNNNDVNIVYLNMNEE